LVYDFVLACAWSGSQANTLRGKHTCYRMAGRSDEENDLCGLYQLTAEVLNKRAEQFPVLLNACCFLGHFAILIPCKCAFLGILCDKAQVHFI